MSEVATLMLPADVRSAGRARRHLRASLGGTSAERALEAAELAVSELVTNAVVHAGTDVELRVCASDDGGLRVEVADGSPHLPVRRHFATTAGTGRGLHLLDRNVDRWDVAVRQDGKTVWFEIGEPDGERPGATETAVGPRTVEVVLLHVPLLMHTAWQEHAASLLREQLLYSLGEDPDAVEHHACASDALNILAEQVPVPELPDEPDALMADAVEPGVSAERLVLRVPVDSVPRFEVLEDVLGRAVREAAAGNFLGPPTQPEIDEMRRWLCREVTGQARAGAVPTPWTARTDVRTSTTGAVDLRERYRQLSSSDEPILVTDEASVIVAVTAPVLEFLGYGVESELVGRRVITVVPERFHQAHIAGTTLHVTNGRDRLIGVPVTVPVLRADGSEAPVVLTVTSRRLDDRHRVFVGRFDLSG